VLHLGNLRTAVVAWAFARLHGARFLVRVEDLDPDRTIPGMAAQQLADLSALGVGWDEPPLVQSERAELYRECLQTLAAAGLVYPCFCTRAEIRAAASAPNAPLGLDSPTSGARAQAIPGAYPGTCACLSTAAAQRRVRAGEDHCLRARAGDSPMAFTDRLLGRIEGLVDDFVVRRKDGVAAYNVAVVVDDAASCIGEVVRGADLADSTPRQLWLARALGLPAPSHAHVPLVVGPDGARLAKRHGSVTLADVRTAGATAEDVLGWMAWTLGQAQRAEPIDADDFLQRFDPERIPRQPTVFNGLKSPSETPIRPR